MAQKQRSKDTALNPKSDIRSLTMILLLELGAKLVSINLHSSSDDLWAASLVSNGSKRCPRGPFGPSSRCKQTSRRSEPLQPQPSPDSCNAVSWASRSKVRLRLKESARPCGPGAIRCPRPGRVDSPPEPGGSPRRARGRLGHRGKAARFPDHARDRRVRPL